MFYHPKYYKELRKRNKSDQVISKSTCDGESERAPGPGLKPQAASDKQEVTSYKLPGPRPISNANKGLIHRRQATSSQTSSDKPQATSNKHQAASRKRQAAQ